MKKTIVLILCFLTTVSAVFGFEIVSPSEVMQGEVLVLTISDNDAPEEISVSLERDGSVLSKTRVFRIDSVTPGRAVAILGVPSTMEPGLCEIRAVSESGERTASCMICRQQFIEEEIALSRSMSTLRKSDDSRKTQQWRDLLSILRSVDSSAVYETGVLRIPVDNIKRTSFFGDRRIFRYDDGTSARSIHNGVDYSGVPGTEIFAAGRGRVVFAGERIISGKTVVLEHLPGLYSLYYHMDSIDVAEGAVIDKGRRIGTIGATGLVTGAHLHWEVRAAGVAVDPEALTEGSIIDKILIISSIE